MKDDVPRESGIASERVADGEGDSPGRPIVVDYQMRPQRAMPSPMAVSSLACGAIGFVVPGAGLIGIGLAATVLRQKQIANYSTRRIAGYGLKCSLLSSAVMGCVLCYFLYHADPGDLPERAKCRNNMLYLYWKLVPADGLFTASSVSEVTASKSLLYCAGADQLRAKSTVTSKPTSRTDYYYLAPSMHLPVGRNTPILVERLSNHGGNGAHVLFGNGEVYFMGRDSIVYYLTQLRDAGMISFADYDEILNR